MPKIHLDTDLGGDIDDLCALALLLGWPGGVELAGVTVVGDTNGRRAGYTRFALDLAGRADVPVAAGADTSGGYYPYELGLPPEERYWGAPVPALPAPAEAALDLLEASIRQGAALIAIGPLTNLALLERRSPGILEGVNLYIMGGYLYPPREGFPRWGNEMDFNIQVDVKSARLVLERSNPTLIPLAVTVETALRRAHLPRLRRAGPLARLIARQAEAFAGDERIAGRFCPTCPALPPDIINFQHDPLACAVALGWREGVRLEEMRVSVEEQCGLLVERADPAGRPVRVVTGVDGPRFSELWLSIVAGS